MKKLLIIGLCLSLIACNNNGNAKPNEHIDSEKNEVVEIVEPLHPYEYDVSFESNTFDENDLIYFIMIDRFKDGDPSNNNFSDNSDNPEDLKHFLGGDLQGIIDELDYIKSLGATAIWLTPIVKNEPFGYHGYWTEDFYSVDPHIGDLDLFKQLVEEAHNRDLKVLLDYVVNHTGYQHPWLNDPSKTDWFHNKGDITNYNDTFQLENHNLAGLPDLNTENPEVKAYFFENALWWIRETNIDGMRLDTVKHVPKSYWNEFAYIIKNEYPDFYFIGEVMNNSASLLNSYHVLGIDGLTNFSMYKGIEDTFTLYGDANALKIALRNESKFLHPNQNGVFLDNHDVNRLLGRTSKYGEEYLKQALTFVMTYPAIPVIYYGTEVGLEGKGDPFNRKLMPWEEIEDNDIFDYYSQLVALRSETRNYTDFEILDVKSSYIVIQYTDGEKRLITAFNVSEYDHTLEIELNGNFVDYLTGNPVESIHLPALSTLILMEE